MFKTRNGGTAKWHLTMWDTDNPYNCWELTSFKSVFILANRRDMSAISPFRVLNTPLQEKLFSVAMQSFWDCIQFKDAETRTDVNGFFFFQFLP